MSRERKELITLIVGGLVYCIISFAYMHKTFSTSDTVHDHSARMTRIEGRVDNQFDKIDNRLGNIETMLIQQLSKGK